VKKIDTRILIGVLVIIFVLALGYSTVNNYLIEYKTVSEVSSLTSTGIIWVNGTIVEGTFETTGTNEYTFGLTDGAETINVNYIGQLPSTLGTKAEVVIMGSFKDSTFHATKLISKCPTKYEG
jgi:cytochrome c-type biogenesis protein CcmE